MATYTQAQLGIKAPAGGFQQGGWYPGTTGGSYQYWNGTFGENGSIHPESDQVGAGQRVSEEINRQTSVAAGLDPNANQDWINRANKPGTTGASSGGSGGSGSGGSGGGGSFTGAGSTINLVDEQTKLYESSGITGLENQYAGIEAGITAMQAEADQRKAEVNENPFLSESSRVGRIAKIDQALNDKLQTEQKKLANLNTQIVTRKNEINEKLGIKVQQYNIDRAAKQDNFNMLNSLLSSGALSTASGQELSDLAAQAGVPLSFVQSAIAASQKADVQIVTETDNNGNVTILTINKETGDIVNQVSAGRLGKSSGGGSTEASSFRGAILNAAADVDKNYQTIDGKLVVNTQKDEFGVDKPDYTAVGDKQLSQQEYDLALDQAYANAGKTFKGTRDEFAEIFDQVLIENGYSSWGN